MELVALATRSGSAAASWRGPQRKVRWSPRCGHYLHVTAPVEFRQNAVSGNNSRLTVDKLPG